MNSSSINQTTTKQYHVSFQDLGMAADKKHNNYEAYTACEKDELFKSSNSIPARKVNS